MARLPMEMDERPMSVEVDGKTMMMTPSEIADMESMDSTGGEAIPAEQDMGLNSMSGMPIMSEEDKELFRTLSDMGIPDTEIIDIMANAKLGEAVEGAATAGINPAEFGGLPKTGSSPASGNPSMPIVGGAGAGAMTNQDMSMYLQNKVKEIRERTGGDMGALSGVPSGNQTPMAMPKPRPAVMPQRLGADRTFNPMDQLTPTNAPNT
jgi:hypothetical protein